MRLILVAVVACLALACGDDKKSAPAQQPAAKKPAPVDEPAPPPDPAAQIPDEALPIAADFEGEADENITADNYAATLDELAQEIDAEPAQ